MLNSSTSTAVVGNISFSVPESDTTGRVIYGVESATLLNGPMYFLPIGVSPSNAKISIVITMVGINTTYTRD
jgi:hypothetical protein